jgi:hypothetical protein
VLDNPELLLAVVFWTLSVPTFSGSALMLVTAAK